MLENNNDSNMLYNLSKKISPWALSQQGNHLLAFHESGETFFLVDTSIKFEKIMIAVPIFKKEQINSCI